MLETNKNTPEPEHSSPTPPFYYSTQFWLKVIVVFQLVLLGVEFSPELSTNGDDAVYYLLGKSLFSGNGYREIFSPCNAIHTQYPPLFPLCIGIAGSFSDTPLVPKIVAGIIAASCVLLFVLLVQRMGKQPFVLPLALFMAFSWSIASHATLLMSEIPYSAATLGGFLLYESSRRKPESRLLFWSAIAAALFPIMIRSIGVAFLGALLCTMVIDKRYKQAVCLLVAGILVLVLLRLYMHENTPYIDQFLQRNTYTSEPGYVSLGEMLRRIGQNISLYSITMLPAAMLGEKMPSFIAASLGLIFIGVIIVGGIGNIRGKHRYIGIYSLMYGAVICMWQTQWAGVRFLIPLIPFIAFLFFTGFEKVVVFVMSLFKKKQGRPVLRLVWIAVVFIVLPNFVSHGKHIKQSSAQSADWRNFYSCADWVRLNTPKNAVVVSRKPEFVYMRSQRKGFVYPFSYDVEKVMEGIRNGGAAYCILDNFSWARTSVKYLFPAIQSHPEMFRVVYSLSNPETCVLEIRRESR